MHERPIDKLAAILRGEHVSWSEIGPTETQILQVCAEEDLIVLMHERLCHEPWAEDWAPSVRKSFADAARMQAARELLLGREIVSALDALASEAIFPILLKGTPLAYSVYDAPAARPRSDTDLLIVREQVDAARRTLAGLGYSAATQSSGELLFRQFEVRKTDAFGVVHAFDFHWKMSTQSVFADVLTYDELAAEAVPVPALGPHARTAGPVHALLLACIHPVMHHRNVERLLWIHDIHLLASRLTPAAFDRFEHLAAAKRVGAIAAHELALARARFGTRVADAVIERLAVPSVEEPSTAYLGPGRRWHNELASNLRGLPSWRDRVRLLREVLVPNPTFMLGASGVSAGPVSTALLPALYVRRLLRGLAKVLTGRK